MRNTRRIQEHGRMVKRMSSWRRNVLGLDMESCNQEGHSKEERPDGMVMNWKH